MARNQNGKKAAPEKKREASPSTGRTTSQKRPQTPKVIEMGVEEEGREFASKASAREKGKTEQRYGGIPLGSDPRE